MYSFAGQFKSTPQVSLGNCQTASAKDVIAASRKAREDREKTKTAEKSVLKLQRTIRSFLCRQRLKVHYRVMLSTLVLQTDEEYKLGRLIYLLNFVFDAQKDTAIWITFCKDVFTKKQRFVLQLQKSSEKGWTFYIKCILTICKKHMLYCVQENQNMTSSLRMMEFLSEVDVLASAFNQNSFQKGFFFMLLQALKSKIPPELSSDIEHCRRLEMFNFVCSILRVTLSSSTSSDCEQSMIEELFLANSDINYTLLLIPEISKMADSFRLILGVEKILLKLVGQMSRPNGFILFYIVLTALQKDPLAKGVINSSNLSGLKKVTTLCGVTSSLTQFYSKELCTKDMKSDLADLDSDDEESMDTQETCSSEETLLSVICECLESVPFISFVANMAATLSGIHHSSNLSNEQQQPPLSHFCAFIYYLNSVHSKSKAFFSLPTKQAFLKQTWRVFTSLQTSSSYLGQAMPMVVQLKSGHLSISGGRTLLPLLGAFSRLFSLLLMTLDDKELFDPSCFPFSKNELMMIIGTLKDCALGLIDIIHPESKVVASSSQSENIQRASSVFKLVCQLLKQLNEKDQRLKFSSSEDFWTSDRCVLPKSSDDMTICEALRRGVDLETVLSSSCQPQRPGVVSEGPKMSIGSAEPNNLLSVVSVRDRRLLVVLTCLPFLINFEKRVKLFRKIISLDKSEVEDRMLPLGVGSSIDVNIRRTHVYEDAFDYLSPQNAPDLRKRMRITWRNFSGLDEAGIDGGGITRDFLQELTKSAFDPKLGFFATTPQGAFYPFPQVAQIMDPNIAKQHFYFIGRIVGKVLYENLLVELAFAPFFLAKILSGHVDINYLASLDEELHESLMAVKTYPGDVEDMTLTFCRTQDVLGEIKEVELIPEGKEIEVTNSNKLFYIHTVADYWLNRQIKMQYTHFVAGLADLISINWLRMFNAVELQTLISGSSISIDITDWRQHTTYAGGDDHGRFSDTHPYIEEFWKILSGWDNTKHSSLLKFITSCSRPPLLGFKEVYPPIAIHSAGASEDRLPTASVCMNILKLPVFPTPQIMEEKLLMAIESRSGFELS